MSYQYPQLSMGSADSKSNTLLQELLNKKSGAGLKTDGIFGPKTNQAVKNYQRQNGLQVDGIVGPKTWASLLADHSAAPTLPNGDAGVPEISDDDLNKALEATKEAYEEQKKEPYAFGEQELLDQAAKDYLQRAAFSYELSADPLYQQYAAQYIRAGRQAMEDTVGMAAAMTGGYGNSYAQTAGQQAYGGYLQQLGDRIPELYELAFSKYEKEGERLRNRYALLRELESQAYDRYQNAQQEAYEKEQDSVKAEQEKKALLAKLIPMGYEPTNRELKEAGMTRQQANMLMLGGL